MNGNARAKAARISLSRLEKFSDTGFSLARGKLNDTPLAAMRQKTERLIEVCEVFKGRARPTAGSVNADIFRQLLGRDRTMNLDRKRLGSLRRRSRNRRFRRGLRFPLGNRNRLCRSGSHGKVSFRLERSAPQLGPTRRSTPIPSQTVLQGDFLGAGTVLGEEVPLGHSRQEEQVGVDGQPFPEVAVLLGQARHREVQVRTPDDPAG